jgi:hypothetical protein
VGGAGCGCDAGGGACLLSGACCCFAVMTQCARNRLVRLPTATTAAATAGAAAAAADPAADPATASADSTAAATSQLHAPRSTIGDPTNGPPPQRKRLLLSPAAGIFLRRALSLPWPMPLRQVSTTAGRRGRRAAAHPCPSAGS